MKTNPLTSLLNKARTALCPCTPRPVGAFKEVRSEVLSRQVGSRTIACPGAQPNSPASLAEGGGGKGAGGGLGTQPQKGIKPQRSKGRFAKYLIPTAILLFLIAVLLTSCKSPATLTNDTQHHARDSNYHATVHRIETHDTIVIGIPTPSLCREGWGGSCEGRGGSPLLRISDRTITLHDTVFILRTDTLLRTQTITKPQKYIPPFYRFCTISFVSFVSFVTLAFYIRLLLRYLKRFL